MKECCLYVGPVMMYDARIVQASIPPSITATKPVMDVMHLSQFQLRRRGVALRGMIKEKKKKPKKTVFRGMTAAARAGGDE